MSLHPRKGQDFKDSKNLKKRNLWLHARLALAQLR
jgi:hypothetical protein